MLLLTIIPGAARAQLAPVNLPNIILGCIYYKPQSKPACSNWVRNGDHFDLIVDEGSRPPTLKEFDAAGVVFLQGDKGTSGETLTFSGKIAGNHIDGTVTFAVASLPPPLPHLKWSAWLFYPPRGNPAKGSHVYVACKDKVSVINTADHSVRTVNLDEPDKPTSAIVVSPDSSTAYVSNEADPGQTASIFVIDGGSAKVSRKFRLKDVPTPLGVNSLAVSGDNSTLYGVGLDKPRTGTVIVALDAASGALKASQPVPKSYTGARYLWNPRLVISGSTLVMDDGTVADTASPTGAPAIFGSDSHGLAAFPNGTQMCSGDGVVTIRTKAINRRQGCSAITPTGDRTYAGGQLLKNQEGTASSNPIFGAAVSRIWGGSVGITPDGKTLYTIGNGGVLYTIDTATNLTTDAIRACESPKFLGMPPLGAAKQ